MEKNSSSIEKSPGTTAPAVPQATSQAEPDRGKTQPFRRGVLYLLDKQKIDYHMDLFADQVRQNNPGLCISRQHPEQLRERYRLENTPILWLSNTASESERVVKPGQISGLMTTVDEFIATSKNGVILLDGLEYLISRNSFDLIIRCVQYLNDRIMVSDCSALIPIDTRVLDQKQLHMLLTEMTELKAGE